MYKLTAILAVVVCALDQFTKWLILEVVMQPVQTFEITGFFNIVLAFNRGVSFGLFGNDAAIMPYILSAVAAVIVVALLVWLREQDQKANALAVGLVVGGAIGNVIDRLRIGMVVDFLDFHLAGWHWPAFNVADTAIFLGVAVLMFASLFGGVSEGKR
ncbi:signal peptidase II [Denitrobaculum tricleocarpae]|uniref:Lipoprotein signal peptidase n=2 Tax=Denitrobaculum tricleocarpae TaxID=2591009 RepID=A0A545U3B3_9PROT|nr:signal peptidase II [Denitrobaculum tricleocarpae]TQV83938.1 signal peptidase II [Denitrobaculum tricleocarpae]